MSFNMIFVALNFIPFVVPAMYYDERSLTRKQLLTNQQYTNVVKNIPSQLPPRRDTNFHINFVPVAK